MTIGTPWHPDDLYAVLLKRNEVSQTLAVRIDPAWTVKPHAQQKDIHSLLKEDVDLMFPERLTFEFLKQELGSTPKQARFFRMQNLCEFVASEEDELKLNFDIDSLRKSIIAPSMLPNFGDVLMSVDTANSASSKADLTALSVLKLCRDPQTKEVYIAVLWMEE